MLGFENTLVCRECKMILHDSALWGFKVLHVQGKNSLEYLFLISLCFIFYFASCFILTCFTLYIFIFYYFIVPYVYYLLLMISLFSKLYIFTRHCKYVTIPEDSFLLTQVFFIITSMIGLRKRKA